MKVLTTTNYKQFTFPLHGRRLAISFIETKVAWVNQPADGRHRRLVLTALEFDLPILVNKDMVILEGKHRFEILKRLELPIKYTVVERVTALINANKLLGDIIKELT